MENITKKLYPESKRMEFLPKFVGKKFMKYETMIYEYLDCASEDYNGGFWEFYTLSNGGFYMAVESEKRFRMEWPDNYYEGEMSADAASIGVNLFVQNAFAWEVDAERFTDAFHQLRDYAAEHAEAPEIFRFID